MHLRGQLQRFVILPSPRLLHFSHRLRSVQSLPSNILSSLCNPSFRMLGALNLHLPVGRCRHNFQGRDSSLPNPTSGANAKHQPRSGPRQPAFLRTGDFWITLGSHQSRFAGSPSALRYGLSLFSHPHSGLCIASREAVFLRLRASEFASQVCYASSAGICGLGGAAINFEAKILRVSRLVRHQSVAVDVSAVPSATKAKITWS